MLLSIFSTKATIPKNCDHSEVWYNIVKSCRQFKLLVRRYTKAFMFDSASGYV